MKIALCLIISSDKDIVKLENAVESVVKYVDGVYITANGDKTDLIEKYCKLNNFHYSYLKWDSNFSEQRNFNFSHAKDYDYIFWMDSDDVLVGGEFLRPIAELAQKSNQDLIYLSYWYGCRFEGEPSYKNLKDVEMEHMRERLIRPTAIKWVGRLHETPVPHENTLNNYTQVPYSKDQQIAIMHTASTDDGLVKMNRNREILELQLEEEKQKGRIDPRTELYLMKIYAEEDIQENQQKVIEMGESYLKKSGWDEERANAWELMGIVEQKRHNFDKAIYYYHEAIKEWGVSPMHYLRLASSYFSIKNYRLAKQFLNFALHTDIDNKTGGIRNLKGMKIIATELMFQLAYQVDRNIEVALKSAKTLYDELQDEESYERFIFMQDLNDLNDACRSTHKLCIYLKSIGQEKTISNVLSVLPEAITKQDMISKLLKDVKPPRKWYKDEICYFANSGTPHFEKWDSSSLKKGIGGSETAVIELSKRFAKEGYKVTVYGDPVTVGIQDGVNYRPYNEFNPKDSFNIFIQWRGWNLSSHIKCKKFYSDLHDLYNGIDIRDAEKVDKFIVKSDFHRSLAPNLDDNKFLIISNGY